MKKWILAVVLAGVLLPVHAQLQRKYQYGVEPTENITSLEINPTFTAIDDSAGISATGVTAKMYKVIDPNWNWGVEVPLSRFESPEKSVSGLGDITLAVNWMRPESIQGGFGYGAHMEIVAPSATDKRLGRLYLRSIRGIAVFLPLLGTNNWFLYLVTTRVMILIWGAFVTIYLICPTVNGGYKPTCTTTRILPPRAKWSWCPSLKSVPSLTTEQPYMLMPEPMRRGICTPKIGT